MGGNLATGRIEVGRSVDIDADSAAVWQKVGRFGDMSWHPAIHATDDPDGEAIGAVRLLTLGQAGGPVIREELVECSDEDRRYAYRILDVDPTVLPVVNYVSSLAVDAAEGGGSRLHWTSRFDPAEGVEDAAAADAIAGVYTAGLDAVKATFKG